MKNTLINKPLPFVSNIFTFPHPVNEFAARTVAGMVSLVCLIILFGNAMWLLPVLTYGFLARVFTGPTLSPMGLLATKAIVPLMGNPSRPVPGPPKRFAQAIGFCFSITATMLFYVWGLVSATKVTIAILLAFATLESVLGFCAGCFVFGYLMRVGLIPKETCEKCANLTFQ